MHTCFYCAGSTYTHTHIAHIQTIAVTEAGMCGTNCGQASDKVQTTAFCPAAGGPPVLFFSALGFSSDFDRGTYRLSIHGR